MSLAFLACIESGPLEPQTVLLCRSIRRFGGRYRDASVYTFSPREGHAISSSTLRSLAELGASHRTEVLNREFTHYPVGNKIFACARAEEVLADDVLVFLDSDTLFTQEPVDLDLPAGWVAAVRPAHSVGHNSTGPGHPMDAYWMRVYALLGIDREHYVTTEFGTVTRAFFSAGLIAVRRAAGLFRQWRSDFHALVDARCLPDSGVARLDEIALATTVLRVMDRVRLLDERYNYLIFKRDRLLPPWDQAQLEQLVHVHYRRSFAEEGFLHRLRPPLDRNDLVLKWLEPLLPLIDPTP